MILKLQRKNVKINNKKNPKKLMTSFSLLVLLHNIMDRRAAKMLLSLGPPNVMNRACDYHHLELLPPFV